jgi:hypothetical protein
VEQYTVVVDGSVRTKEQLFARFTDTVFLGESGISGWDWFYDLLFNRLYASDISVAVVNQDLTGLPEVEQANYAEALASIQVDAPGKLWLVKQGGGAAN